MSLSGFRAKVGEWGLAKAALVSVTNDHLSKWADGARRADYDRYYAMVAVVPAGVVEERHPVLAANVMAYEAQSARFAVRREQAMRAVHEAHGRALEAMGTHVGKMAAAEIAARPGVLMPEVVERCRMEASRLRTEEFDGIGVAGFVFDGVGPLSMAFLKVVAEAKGIAPRGPKWFNRVTEGLRQPVYGIVRTTFADVRHYCESVFSKPVTFGVGVENEGESDQDDDAVVLVTFRLPPEDVVGEFAAFEAAGLHVVSASVRDPWFRRSVLEDVAADMDALDVVELQGERDYAAWEGSPMRRRIEAEIERRAEETSMKVGY
jgi:hypothetical protein